MRGRILPLTAGTAAWNMAADQAILESVERTAVPTLRFYSWRQPSLSLGYFQRHDARQGHTLSGQVTCVRRATGGGAILHHHELTYSLTVPMPASATRDRQRLYREVHWAISRTLAGIGIDATPYHLDGRPGGQESAFLCFQRRTDQDLIVSGYKILGSAQRRSRAAVLQHGSLLLRASPFAPELPGIVDLSSKRIDPFEITHPVAQHLGRLLRIDWESGPLTADEHRRGQQIESEKFATSAWTQRR
jgi:lipoate-protein ligase A